MVILKTLTKYLVKQIVLIQPSDTTRDRFKILMARKILTRKWWQLSLAQRNPWRKLEIKWEWALMGIWISSRFYKCLEIIQEDRELAEWVQILFSNCWWQRLKQDMTLTIQMKWMARVMNLDRTTLERKELALANLSSTMFTSLVLQSTKTQDRKKGKKESHLHNLQELMVQVLFQARLLEGEHLRDSRLWKLKNDETVLEGLPKKIMMKMYLEIRFKDGIQESPPVDLKQGITHSLGMLELRLSKHHQTWDPAACHLWIKETWHIVTLRTRISLSGSTWVHPQWMNALIEEWVSMNHLAQEVDFEELETEGLQTQSQIVFRAK